MYVLIINNCTSKNYKIKYNNKNFKIKKNEKIEIKSENKDIVFEIIDSSFYNFKTVVKSFGLFFILFIPYVACLSFENENLPYSFFCDYKCNNLKNEIIFLDNNKDLFVQDDLNNIINLKFNNKSSLIITLVFSLITLLLYCLIILILYYIFS